MDKKLKILTFFWFWLNLKYNEKQFSPISREPGFEYLGFTEQGFYNFSRVRDSDP